MVFVKKNSGVNNVKKLSKFFFLMEHKALFSVCLLIFALSACIVSKKNEGFTPFPTIVAGATSSPIMLQTETATPTQEPLAALVNGEGIALSEYEAELLRYQAAQNTAEKPLEAKEKQSVLNDLIQLCLLSQWAKENGYPSTEEEFQQRLQSLIQESGGEQAFREWLQQNHYDEHSFKVALARQLAAAWARDKLAAQVPTAADQVHARQIYFYDETTAQQTMARLNNGETFEAVAAEFDPLTGGELGWFPQGYVLEPEIDEAIFGKDGKGGLEVGAYSQIIHTRLGYHIVKVVEKQEQRPLAADALLQAQQRAVQRKLQELTDKSKIEVLVH